MGGVLDPQIRGKFLIEGETWQIEDRGNDAIQGQSKNFSTVSLIMKNPTNKGQRELRRYE